MSRLSVRYFSWRSAIEAAVFGYFVWERLIRPPTARPERERLGLSAHAHCRQARAPAPSRRGDARLDARLDAVGRGGTRGCAARWR